MKPRHKARDLAKLTGLLRASGGVRFEREHEDGRISVLAHVRPSTTAKGNGSLRTVLMAEDGKEVAYDGRYEFVVSTIIVNGFRFPLSVFTGP